MPTQGPLATHCPTGHELKTDDPSCTAVYCKDVPYVDPAFTPSNPKAIVPAAPTKAELEQGESDTAYTVELSKLRKAEGRMRARMDVLKTPRNLKGKQAEDFADAKAIELLPYAMAVLEHQLKHGDDKQQAEAARDVRDMTGRGKRDGSGSNSPTILIIGNADGQNPFLKRVEVEAKPASNTPTTDAPPKRGRPTAEASRAKE